MSHPASIIFIPHGGGPLPLLNDPGHAALNRFLTGLAATIAKPSAIIVVSAHWEAPQVSVTASPAPSLLFDYQGFPAQAYRYQYPARGHPALAKRVQELLHAAAIDARLDRQRGFDHGLFVPLLLMYPGADLPCIQISLDNSLDAARHLRIGQALAELKNDNVLVLGSGFSFHNLPALMSKADAAADPRNLAFEAWLAQTCADPQLSEAERVQRLTDWELAPHARYCHPRAEHLLPLQVCHGIGQCAARQIFRAPVAGFIASAYQWD